MANRPVRRVGERFFRLLLRAYPQAFRQRFKDDLLEAFRRDRLRPQFRGPTGAVRFWGFTLRDLLRTAVLVRRSGTQPGDQSVAALRAGARIPRQRLTGRPEPSGRPLTTVLETFWQDVKYGVRGLARQPGFTFVATLTLTIGIGLTVAAFGVVHHVILRPLPYPDPDRLVTLWSQEDWLYGTNGPEYFDFRQRQQSLDDIALYRIAGANGTVDGDPVRLTLAAVTGGFFEVLGVRPVEGRTFSPEEDQPGRNLVVVLRHAFWRLHFGADPAIVGQTMAVNETPVTIVGVMPPGFRFPDDSVDLWFPMALNPAGTGRGGHGLWSVARLRPDVSLDRASGDMRRISMDMHAEHPEDYPEAFRSSWTVRLEPLHASLVGDVQPALLMLAGATVFVLLIGCVNVANLLLARGSVRGREMSVRNALGASRGRLVRQLLTESIVLSSLGGAGGWVAAVWATGALSRLIPPGLVQSDPVGVDVGLLGLALGVSLATSLTVGVVPAVFAGRSVQPPGSRARLTDSGARERFRRVLIVGEIALTLMLLVGAGLMTRSFYALRTVDAGFRTEGVLTFHVSLPARRYQDLVSSRQFFDTLTARLRSLPGVENAGAISVLPLQEDFSVAVMAEGMAPTNQSLPHGLVGLSSPRTVTPGYFSTMSINLLEGRFFDDSDTDDGPRVAIVSEAFANVAWPGDTDVIGKRIAFATRNEPAWATIVGVTRDVREEAGNLASQRYKDAYFPMTQQPSRDMFLTLRGGGITGLIDAIRSQVADLDPRVPVYDVAMIEDVVARAVGPQRVNALLMSVFGVIALVLGAVGVYGVIAYTVSQRTTEIGLRVALGARRSQILGSVLRRGLAPVLVGVGAGLAAGGVLSKYLQSLLFETAGTDWRIYLAAAGLLVAVALLACWVPAVRATHVDPAIALRDD